VATHAIGDRAIELVLNCYAEAQKQKTRHRPRHRIEHSMLLDPGLIRRMRRQNVWSIGQPEFISRLGDAYISALGEARAFRLSPYASLEENDVAQAFSSDCPVVPGAPLAGIRAALERKTPAGVTLNAEEKLSIETALYNYTAAPAWATRTERDRGTLEIGKLGDFVVLTGDILKQSIGSLRTESGTEWDSLDVEATYIGGECLYSKHDLG